MISLEAVENGAKAYSTLKRYTKDELIEEIRILEHNLASKEEQCNNQYALLWNITQNVPEANDYLIKEFEKDKSSAKLMRINYGD